MNGVSPCKLLQVGQLLEMAAPVAKLSRLLCEDSDVGSARTGFCYTTLAHTAVLAMTARWLRLAIKSPHVSCILTTPKAHGIVGQECGKPTLLLENADETFYYLHNRAIHEQTYPKAAWDSAASIASSASVDETAVVRGAVTIEDGVVVGPLCVINGPARIGRDTVIHEHCTIGTAGLFSKKVAGRMQHVRHFGGVSVGQQCQIHAGANIARSVNFGRETTIEDAVSVGIRAVVGHDVTIGRETVVSSCAAILGRARVGEGCWIGAGALISNSLTVGDRAKIRLGAAVIQDVPDDADVSGNFARPHHKTLRALMQ